MRVVLRMPHPLAPGLPRMVSLSAAGHLAILMLSLLLPGLLPRSKGPAWDAVIPAQLMHAPALGGPPLVPLSKPAAAAPRVPEPEPEPELPPPPPKNKPKARPKPPPGKQPDPPKPRSETKPRTERRQTSPETETSSGTATDTRSDPVQPGTGAAGETGVGIAFQQGVNFTSSLYPWQIKNRLEANWQKPVYPLGMEGNLSVRIAFTIQRNGTVTDVRIISPSRYPAMDQSAMRAVYSASPLPPMPAQRTENSLRLAYTFTLEPTGL